MIIIGIDPGTADTGYGVIRHQAPTSQTLAFGSIKTDSDQIMPDRLKKLYIELGKVFKKFSPDIVVVERLFFNTNQKTAMSVGQARGIVLLLCAQHKCEMTEYTALQAKLEVTGYGRADKKQIESQVRKILKIKGKIRPDDAADGLAMALCYLSKNELLRLKKSML